MYLANKISSKLIIYFVVVVVVNRSKNDDDGVSDLRWTTLNFTLD
jgi:hypothetical protein